MKFLKKLFTLIIVLISMHCFGQSPDAFSFQGVAYDNNGAPIANQEIEVVIDLLTDAVDMTSIYSELHEVTTGPSGLFTLQIGRGAEPSTSFSNIDWGASSHYLKVSIDVDGSGEFSIMGITELLSVPYALYAENAGVEPSFYVNYKGRRGPQLKSTILKSFQGGTASQNFDFQWLSGPAQDVYVDYFGLPAEVCIRQDLWNSFQVLNPKLIHSKVDTIYDGYYNPSSALILCNQGIFPTKGVYDITQYFRIDDTVHDSLNFTLEIFNNSIDGCFPDGPLTYAYSETTCSSSIEGLVNEVTISPVNEDLLSVSSPIDSIGPIEEYYYFSNCLNSINVNWSNFPPFFHDISVSRPTVSRIEYRVRIDGNYCGIIYER